MPDRSVSVTVSMSTELDSDIAEQAEEHNMNYSKYVRTVLRNSTETPFSPSDVDLTVDDSDAAEAQTGGA